MNLINPVFSFVVFKPGTSEGSLLDTEDSGHLETEEPLFIVLEDGSLQTTLDFNSLPISEEDDLKFQLVLETETKEEADALTEGVKIYLVKAGAVIIDAPSLDGNILVDYSDVDHDKLPMLIRISEKKVLVYWPHGIPDFKSKVDPYTCAKLALTFPDGEETQYYTSNKLAHVPDKRFTSVLEYYCEENAYDFYYCTDGIVNRARIPMYLNRPQFQDDESVYVKSNGQRKLLKSVTRKEYQGQTEMLTDQWHDRIKYALSHDSVHIWGYHFTGGISKNGNYERDWPDFMDFEGSVGKFKVLASPYNWRNSNCEECQPYEDTPSEENTCNVVTSDVLIMDDDQVPGQNWRYSAIWNHSSQPNEVLWSYSVDGGATWQIIPNILDVEPIPLDQLHYDLGAAEKQDHMLRITPKCANGIEGTPGIGNYVAEDNAGCQAIDHIDIVNITTTEAEFSWPKVTPTPAGGYDWRLYIMGLLRDSGNTWNPGDPITLHLTGLTPGMHYSLRVRSHCSDDSVSEWRNKSFDTQNPPTNVTIHPLSDVDINDVRVDGIVVDDPVPFGFPVSTGTSAIAPYSNGAVSSIVDVDLVGTPGVSTVRIIDSNGVNHDQAWIGDGRYTFPGIDTSNGFTVTTFA